MSYFLILCIGFYVLTSFFLLLSLRKTSPAATLESFPYVSVLVAARNEAHNLPACLDALLALDYPREKLELIVIDDGSQDETLSIARQYQQQCGWLRVLAPGESENHIPGKGRALAKGIDAARGEFIFVTDADCTVPPTWIKGLLVEFDPETALVGGFTLLKAAPSSAWQKAQGLDVLFLLGMAYAMARRGRPLSWLGNNLAFRRRAYEQVGGAEIFARSLVEDFALIRAFRRAGWRIRFTPAAAAFVSSRPQENLREFYHQRKRWASGISKVPLDGVVLLVTSFATHWALVAGLFMCPVDAILFAFFAVLVMDLSFLVRLLSLLGRRDLLIYFPLFQGLYFAYTMLFPLLFVVDRRIIWKDFVWK